MVISGQEEKAENSSWAKKIEGCISVTILLEK
jgi:hypothetical protein